MEAEWRGRRVPVLNEMTIIKVNELFKHSGVGTSLFFHEVVLSSHYTWVTLGRERGWDA